MLMGDPWLTSVRARRHRPAPPGRIAGGAMHDGPETKHRMRIKNGGNEEKI